MKIKFCGMTRREDVDFALRLGVDYIGFVFYAKSPRAVTVEQVAAILARADSSCRPVGVFVNASYDEVSTAVRRCCLHAVQLHGEERIEDYRSLPCHLWQAVRVAQGQNRPEEPDGRAELYVVDSSVPGMYGGTGMTADWNYAADVARKQRILLAGGLTAENIREAVRCVHPFGVDLSSGIEASPGLKDQDKMYDVVKAVRAMEKADADGH